MLVLSTASCNNCLGDGALEVSGDSPFVRCLAARSPSVGSARVGKVAVRGRDRELTIDGLRYPTRLAAFSGPGLGDAPGPAALAALRAAKPDLILLLGDVGDTPQKAAATLKGLAAIEAPSLVLAGGRDSRDRLAGALGALAAGRERIIDVTTVREVRLSHDTLVPIAGSEDGRYALEAHGCGYGLADLKQVALDLLEARGNRRWLLAWHAPSAAGPQGVAQTNSGLELGSSTLAELAKRIGAPGGIFGWPHTQALRPSLAGGTRRTNAGVAAVDLQIVVPRISGPPIERDDGSRVPASFALLELSSEGLRLLPQSSAP